MINFVCRCGHRFTVTEDQIGGSEQCPECKLLVDVPHIDDLPNLAEDGTYKMDEAPKADDPRVIEEFKRTYLPGRMDEEGNEYDLRPTAREIMDSGVEEIPLKEEDADRPNVPKYDPLTGELVRPMALKKEEGPAPEAIPVAQTAIGYATGYTADGVRVWAVPVALLMPANIAVIAVIFVVHLFSQLFLIPLGGGFFLLAPLPVLVFLMVVAHYGNVVDDVGRMERDELPGLLRGLSWSEDLWHPFVAGAQSLMICYGPAYFVLSPGNAASYMLSVVLAGAGTMLFPAVFLTASTSGTVFNMRPDRVLGVIRVCWAEYLPMVLLWGVAAGVYAVSLAAVTAHAMTIMRPRGPIALPIPLVFFYATLLVGVYLMHLFCWYLGLLYRKHQPEFPWVFQHHEWAMKDEQELRMLRQQRQRQKRIPPVVAAVERGVVAEPVRVQAVEEAGSGEAAGDVAGKKEAAVVQSVGPKGAVVGKAKLAGARAHLMAAMRRAGEDRRAGSEK